MPMQDAFRDFIVQAIAGEVITAFDTSNAYIGVGDDNAVVNPAHTDLQAAVNKVRSGMKSGLPTITANAITYEARFEEADGNFAWLEAGIFNAAAGGLMMNRFLDDSGVKPVGEIWDYEITVTIVHS